MEDQQVGIVLPVHVLKHPDRGVYIVDTGVPDPLVAEGIVLQFVDMPEVVEPIGSILSRHGVPDDTPFAAAMLTHGHIDHVLGIPGLPEGADIYVGPGEYTTKTTLNAATRATMDAVFAGRPPLKVWDFDSAPRADIIQAVIGALDTYTKR